MTPVVIASRVDALLWTYVDSVFDGADPQEAWAEFELAYHRNRAAYYRAGGDWLLALMIATDPRRIGHQQRRAA